MPNDDLDTLYTTLYPATTAARRAYGARWDSACPPSLLDWTVIRPSLWRAGFVVPGPTIDRVSFWYVTWRFERFGRTFRQLEAMLVGPGWEGCIKDALRRGTTTGPKRLKHGKYVSRRVFRNETANQGLTYAFRFLDEPVRWDNKGLRQPRVRGVAPTRWQHVPWYAPSDLEERHCSPDDHQHMGEDEAEKIALADLVQVELTIERSSDADVLEGCIKSLQGLMLRFRSGAPHEKPFHLLPQAKHRFDDILRHRVLAAIANYRSTNDGGSLESATTDARRISDATMQTSCVGKIWDVRREILGIRNELDNEHGIEEPPISDFRKEGPSRPTWRSR